MTMLDQQVAVPVPAEKQRELVLRLLRDTDGAAKTPGAEITTVEPDPARRHDPFPLTDIQQAYWIGRSCGYELGDVSIHAYVEVDASNVDLQRLERSWQQVVNRHDMLRAVILPDGRQRILPVVQPYRVQVTDLRGANGQVMTDALAAIREELSHQVFPADSWPGFEIRATLMDEGRSRVHVSVDLLHVDGGSLMILVDEWMRLYRDDGAELPGLELSYRDYVLGEISLRGSAGHRRSAEYWRGRVATLPPAPALPVRPAPQTGHTRFRRRQVTLERAGWQRLKALATSFGLTPSTVLLTAYADILACWSEYDAFTLNVTLFNRLPIHPQVNDIVGDFTSMILLEVPQSPESSFVDRASGLQRQLWAGLDHRHISGVEVLRELAQARRSGTRAQMPVVFTSMLDLASQGFRPPVSSLRTLGEVAYAITQTPQVWLDHQVLEEDGALVLTWDAVEEIFPAGLLDDMFATYGRLLRTLADDDSAWQLCDLVQPPPDQLAQRIQVNATASAVPGDTLPGLFLRQARLRPDHPAVITPDRTMTYAEVRRHANRLGHRLRALGAQPDSLIAVVLEKGWEQVVGVLGIQLAGAAYLPVDPNLPTERCHYLLANGEVRIAVTQRRLDQALEWPAAIERINVDAIEDDAVDDDWLVPRQRPNDLSHVIYTSGSTGLPKGVMIEHRNVVNRIVDVNQRLGVGPEDRMLGLTALHHDLSVYDIFGILAAGAAMVLPDVEHGRDPGHWAELMVRHGVTMWNSVPTFLQMLVEYLERPDHPEQLPDSLRCVVLAGDWIPVTLPDRLRRLVSGAQVIASGGPTETTIWDIWYPIGEVDPGWPSIPYGRPMNNTCYHVFDRALRPRPVWVAGQLYIGGAGLARGYWRNEAMTASHFITHPATGERLYRSGDLGRFLPNGNIELLGREDSQAKICGHRIELGEIEATLHQHPEVAAAAVAAAGEPNQLQRLVAFVVPERALVASPNASRNALAGEASDRGQHAAVDQRFLAGVSILDPAARIDFKLQQWGIRRDRVRDAVPLPRGEPDGVFVESFSRRRSLRDFLPGPIPLAAFGDFLRSLSQVELDGLPKYRYASGGGLYPVQTYLYIKPGRVAGIGGGVYYHNPKEHQLILISSEARLDASTQLPHNREMFDKAAFVIFLIGQLAAVQPLYGALARDFCLLEAGYMSQLLMSVAPDHRIGLCPVGAMDFESIQHFFDLDDGHVLVHLLIGGQMDSGPPQQPQAAAPAAVTPREPTDQARNALADDLRAFLSRTLPQHMLPAGFVFLDSLPLTPNGKVDRRLLLAAEAGAPAEPDVPPRTAIERELAAITQDVLRLDRLSVHHNFFDLGGTSVHMLQILNRVRSALGREVPVTEIFRHPTVSSLAAYLSGSEKPPASLDSSEDRAERRRAVLNRRAADKRGRR